MIDIVIRMSEAYCEFLTFEGQRPDAHVFAKLVANGTPLPKGHGDLIDANRLVEEHPLAFVRDVVNYAEVIIEADKEGKQE